VGCLAPPNGASGAPGNLASSAHLSRTLTPKAPSGHTGPRPTWPRTLGPAAFEGTALRCLGVGPNNSVAPSSTVALETVCVPLPLYHRQMAHVKGLCEPRAVNRELRSLMKRHCVRRSAQRASQAASYFSIVLKETLKPSSECGQASRHGAS
jgi:hypothetical protein